MHARKSPDTGEEAGVMQDKGENKVTRLVSQETTMFWPKNAGFGRKVAGEDVGSLGGGWGCMGRLEENEGCPCII